VGNALHSIKTSIKSALRYSSCVFDCDQSLYKIHLNMMRKIEEINTGSMADIAFLLLIFFLVVTTIDTQKGIGQKLPPDSEKGTPRSARNIFTILVNSSDELLVEGKRLPLSELKELTTVYLLNAKGDPELPQQVEEFIPGLGNRMVSKQVVSLQNDLSATYGVYIQIHSTLLAAYKELRNKAAIREYGFSYDELKKKGETAKVGAIKSLVPIIISEAEPVKR